MVKKNRDQSWEIRWVWETIYKFREDGIRKVGDPGYPTFITVLNLF